MFGDIEIDDDLLMIKMQNENRLTMNYDKLIEVYSQENGYTLFNKKTGSLKRACFFILLFY